ncbi:MAG: hypothetical protein K9H64_23930 [Bacteroidales bacterium]|nr:hypothetical protein [Bacteroidales bacterium]MCF8455943.1 hypothetical protein [Bacteroidales bacterium]
MLIFLFAIVIGSLAFSVILFAIQQIDFNLIIHMSHSWFEFALGLVPFFWIISLAILLSISFFSFRKSKKGYKFTAISLLSYCTALSILLGTFFFISGGAKWLENSFAINVSLYESVQDKKIKMWSMPDEGYLSGTIESLNDSAFSLSDFNATKWTVDFHGADIISSVRMRVGEKIKIIGKMTSKNQFKAEKIRPWGGEDRLKNNSEN